VDPVGRTPCPAQPPSRNRRAEWEEAMDKPCFHIKKLTPELVEQIRQALKIGFDLYKKNGWV
jgi:hypothetical protein